MNYKLFDEFITLQALFKELGIIQSGGAIKAFLLENQVEVNGEVETRRGRKLRVGDTIEVIGEKEVITLTEPSPEEIEDYQADKLEKVGDLPFALVAPVGAYDCSNHEVSSCFTGACPRRRFPYGLSIPQVFT